MGAKKKRKEPSRLLLRAGGSYQKLVEEEKGLGGGRGEDGQRFVHWLLSTAMEDVARLQVDGLW